MSSRAQTQESDSEIMRLHRELSESDAKIERLSSPVASGHIGRQRKG
jgi:hypothetical protein